MKAKDFFSRSVASTLYHRPYGERYNGPHIRRRLHSRHLWNSSRCNATWSIQQMMAATALSFVTSHRSEEQIAVNMSIPAICRPLASILNESLFDHSFAQHQWEVFKNESAHGIPLQRRWMRQFPMRLCKRCNYWTDTQLQNGHTYVSSVDTVHNCEFDFKELILPCACLEDDRHLYFVADERWT